MVENPIPRDVWKSQMDIFDCKHGMRGNEKIRAKEKILSANEIVNLCERVVSQGFTDTTNREVVYRNMLSSVLISKQLGWGINRIGRRLGKHHSTVIHYFRRMDIDSLKYDAQLYGAWKEVKNNLNINWDFRYGNSGKVQKVYK